MYFSEGGPTTCIQILEVQDCAKGGVIRHKGEKKFMTGKLDRQGSSGYGYGHRILWVCLRYNADAWRRRTRKAYRDDHLTVLGNSTAPTYICGEERGYPPTSQQAVQQLRSLAGNHIS